MRLIVKTTLLLFCSVVTLSALAQSEAELIEELNRRIVKSQQELTSLQSRILEQKVALSSELAREQQSVIALREQVSALQRVADENVLSYEKLNERIGQWNRQHSYQQQLIYSFINNTNFPLSENETEDNTDNLVLFNQRILEQLHPTWTEQSAMSDLGELGNYHVLSLGPVKIGFNSSLEIGGPLIESDASIPLVLTDMVKHQAGLQRLYNNGTGTVVLDPTLGNAYQLMGQQSDIVSHIKKGGVWAFPILAFGLFAVLVAIVKTAQIIRLPKINTTLADDLLEMLKRYSAQSIERKAHLANVKNAIKGTQKELLSIAMDTPVSELRDELLVAKFVQAKNHCERYIGIISICAGVAPLLGLLGTVTGMINTFTMMTVFGTGEASTVSGGISEALVTTELGLVVAIPALIISALLHRSVKSYALKLETDAIKLSKLEFGSANG